MNWWWSIYYVGLFVTFILLDGHRAKPSEVWISLMMSIFWPATMIACVCMVSQLWKDQNERTRKTPK